MPSDISYSPQYGYVIINQALLPIRTLLEEANKTAMEMLLLWEVTPEVECDEEGEICKTNRLNSFVQYTRYFLYVEQYLIFGFTCEASGLSQYRLCLQDEVSLTI